MNENRWSTISPDSIAYLESLDTETNKQNLIANNQIDRQHFDTQHNTLANTINTNQPSQYDLACSYLIDAYRSQGYAYASLDPLELDSPAISDELNPAYYGLKESTHISTNILKLLNTNTSIKSVSDLTSWLKKQFCSSIGWNYSFIRSAEKKNWLSHKIDSYQPSKISKDEQLFILDKLVAAEKLEQYLSKRYVGVKKFGLEGAETFIPMLSSMIENSAGKGIKEVSIGMAHRGRLTALVSVCGKKSGDLFAEFDGHHDFNGSGDVKYHNGFTSELNIKGSIVKVHLAFNPSHLEIVCPIVEGYSRASIDNGSSILPILVHGDASVVGQGVVSETLQLSRLRGFKTGGSIHIIINNQVGFTTSDIDDSRSSDFCSDIAKSIDIPIFRVNGDDPEAALFVTNLAFEYRNRFHDDVMIELVSYRRRGHNEADDPMMTQPVQYNKIKSIPTTCTKYIQKLLDEQILSNDEIQKIQDDYSKKLENKDYLASGVIESSIKKYNYFSVQDDIPFENNTKVDGDTLKNISKCLSSYPKDFSVHRQVAKTIEERSNIANSPINWGSAEMLAYGSLLSEGVNIRLTGQDVRRGTFSHRHACIFDQKTGEAFSPLARGDGLKGKMHIYDAPLSEEAVLGFEYGYSLYAKNTLNIWEAQFGDFANGAQIVTDQIISACEQKWGIYSRLTLLLPHGYEGQGPEHSSARLERFLQLCAQNNLQVCVPTTPSQIFHLLRRQILSKLRKPLIVMSPKSLLRHKNAISTIEDLKNGTFETVIDDKTNIIRNSKKMILCSGKVYYDLLDERKKLGLNTPIIRIEQLYPFPSDTLKNIIDKYSDLKEIIWCQEEPLNQGAWNYSIYRNINSILGKKSNINLSCVGRPISASTATGYGSVHSKELENILHQVFK